MSNDPCQSFPQSNQQTAGQLEWAGWFLHLNPLKSSTLQQDGTFRGVECICVYQRECLY
jgi:hypothetical protein